MGCYEKQLRKLGKPNIKRKRDKKEREMPSTLPEYYLPYGSVSTVLLQNLSAIRVPWPSLSNLLAVIMSLSKF